MSQLSSATLDKLESLYPGQGQALGERLTKRLAQVERTRAATRKRFDAADVLLIAYGDQVNAGSGTGLSCLRDFANKWLKPWISGIHILPHFPYSSDDGFSVIDYLAVDPELGTLDDLRALAGDYELMFDAVINHASSQSEWFKAYLRQQAPYDGFFIEGEATHEALSEVYRPRASPLLTTFETQAGVKQLWTTFSADQVDLNFANPEVAYRILDILITYAEQGARYLRLDAVGFLWKQLGTRCFHLPETHRFVQVVREVFDASFPEMVLVPEINGPFEENLPYLGDGTNEAQLVYNFTLPPLIVHAFATQNAHYLAEWLANAPAPPGETALFNFIACHDGLGVRAVQGLLPDAEMEKLLEAVKRHDAPINYRTGEDGTKVPYELNGTLYELLNGNKASVEQGVQRMACAHAIQCALAGVPGIYFHSFFGTPSWREGLAQTQHNRTLNRYKYDAKTLETELGVHDGRAARTLAALGEILSARRSHAAFAPHAPQQVDAPHEGVLRIRRGDTTIGHLHCWHNLSTETVTLSEESSGGTVKLQQGEVGRDAGSLVLGPLAVLWLEVP